MSDDNKSGEVKKHQIKLNVARLKQADYVRTVHSAAIELGVTREDYLSREFWGHVAAQLKPNDRIEMVAEDGEFFAEVIVVACGRQWAQVAELRFIELTQHENDVRLDDTASGSGDYEVKWSNNADKWRVIRKSDKEVIHKGEATRISAENWLAEYLKALAN